MPLAITVHRIGHDTMRTFSSRAHLSFRLAGDDRIGREEVPVEDLTRFGLVLISIPVAVVAGGLVLGLVGRWVTSRR